MEGGRREEEACALSPSYVYDILLNACHYMSYSCLLLIVCRLSLLLWEGDRGPGHTMYMLHVPCPSTISMPMCLICLSHLFSLLPHVYSSLCHSILSLLPYACTQGKYLMPSLYSGLGKCLFCANSQWQGE